MFKSLFLLLPLLLISQLKAFAQTEFKLDPSQSMLMTGKGPGQDATINPYEGQDCYAIIENIGKSSFSIRVQKSTTLIREIAIKKGETKKVELPEGYQLYLDPNPKSKALARVSYEKNDQ